MVTVVNPWNSVKLKHNITVETAKNYFNGWNVT